jgi:hypothetical protein
LIARSYYYQHQGLEQSNGQPASSGNHRDPAVSPDFTSASTRLPLSS